MPAESILATSDDMRRMLSRIAHELVEYNHGANGIVLAGLQTRGVPLARRLANVIQDIERLTIPVGSLDINLYRDDLTSRPQPLVRPTTFPVAIDGKHLVLVDDVLFTGRSIRAAMDALTDLGRPSQVQLAVMIDRGHRELPIRADYVGKNVPTSLHEEVQVRVIEVGTEDQIVLVAHERRVLV